ncbi:ECF transporter S component, folate family [Pseudobutyrivibrio sp. ACV-2]|uniref:folate family ECF transporter S component n=1 Tax=Pseudobutyrivibrio sp. ACV-2 TaxID=1520801 RepID=UPI000898FC1F|nr:folate family ECF transporter S component [Pseudobutyrivibrio sp. ACV-2]SEA83784.1 ECF transporter S component, folate family [Pseudobutyrivibrio sp. ACV-2]
MKKLFNTKTLTIAAMLTAIGIILGFFKLPITQLIEIRFGSLPVAMAGMMFGPGVAGIVGALIDIGGFLVKPTGPFFPGFTISGIVSGIIFGVMLHDNKCTFLRIFATQAIHTLIVGIIMNSFWLNLLYLKNGYLAAIIARLPKELIMIPVMTVLLYTVLNSLEKVGIRKLAL